jgi:hypothetical protein
VCAGGDLLLVPDHRLDHPEAASAELLRPRRDTPAVFVEVALPGPLLLEVEFAVDGVVGLPLREVLGQERACFVPHRFEVHNIAPMRASVSVAPPNASSISFIARV